MVVTIWVSNEPLCYRILQSSSGQPSDFTPGLGYFRKYRSTRQTEFSLVYLERSCFRKWIGIRCLYVEWTDLSHGSSPSPTPSCPWIISRSFRIIRVLSARGRVRWESKVESRHLRCTRHMTLTVEPISKSCSFVFLCLYTSDFKWTYIYKYIYTIHKLSLVYVETSWGM